MIASNIVCLSISIESSPDKGTTQLDVVWMLFRFEHVTHRVLKFTADELIIFKYSREMSIVLLEKEELSFAMSLIIFPLTDILDLRVFVKICALSMF